MADDFHRPTLTFPDGAYNATQVRLYGISAPDDLSYSNDPKKELDDGSYSIMISPVSVIKNSDQQATSSVVDELRKKKLSNSGIFHNILEDHSVKIPVAYYQIIKFDVKQYGTVGLVLFNSSAPEAPSPNRFSSCGIIVGYAYEGHCYDLPKPKIMVLPTPPVPIPEDDCGYQLKRDSNYRLWVVDKLEECVEFEMNQGFIEQIVLEANLPGKRSPTSYVGRAMLAHRNGRLTD
ncbi:MULTISPECIES: hypothetical protein [Inquilinus]|uniref:Uncharacterized protein n=1 Tax=Inquilinus ginsengisoli TaxID=363840 RepID=A0ABU1JLQ0_9PROT|nr:hypothetical protein [Inquilinus ginsengisoli]MDR6289548.1 hypothetical protein [Inquilinus ginsengisoli]